MPQFQLPIATSLASGAVASWALFHFARPKEGKIRLPIHTDEDEGKDGLDVTKPEDLLDGYPIDLDGFWKRVSSVCLKISFLAQNE